jgi:amidase
MPGPAVEIVRQVQAGELSPRDAVATALARIDRDDATIGAFQVVRREKALAEADALAAGAAAGDKTLASRPLAGLPIAIKDNLPVAGEPMRQGCAATDAVAQAADHQIVRLLRDAGAIVVGLTRVPELSCFGTTDSAFGITRNPWVPGRTAGGSSGGSAAAVAAGMVPAAIGNDGLGSIRIPASCCGIVGVKPGSRLVPAGIGVNDWYGMAENGPLATTVADVALILSVLAGRAGFRDLRVPERPLRLAVSMRPPVPGVAVDTEHKRAVVRTARLLERAGHRLVRANPPRPVLASVAVLARWFAAASNEADRIGARRLERRNRVHAALGRQARRIIWPSQAEAWRRQAGDFFIGYDALLSPVLAVPPIPADQWSERGWLANMISNTRYAPFAAPWNLAGFPAASVPAGVHPEAGTPLSVQIVAPAGGEETVLTLAAQVERLAPWQLHAPGYPTG